MNGIEALAHRLIQSGSLIQGSSMDKIEALEELLEKKLPEAYKNYLAHFGENAGHLLCHDIATIHQISNIQLIGRDRYEYTFNQICPDSIFFFGELQGYSFYFFDLKEGDNPEVKLWRLHQLLVKWKSKTKRIL